MNNPPCTLLSPEEETALMNVFSMGLPQGYVQGLPDDEEALARKFFQPIVFFRQCSEDRQARRCVCTSCMEGFYAHKQTAPDFFRATHGKRCICPNCGQQSTLAAMGKFSNYSSLTSRERAVQLRTSGDWLLIQAGWITRTFDHEDLGGYLVFEPFRRYAFAPGRRMMWSRQTVSWFGDHHPDDPWIREDSIREPFQPRPYEREAAYIPLGFDALAHSSLRWCQYDRWLNDTYGCYVGGLDSEDEPFRIAYLVRYLAEYTRRPQMEFLVKLGHFDILRDLVLRKKPHGNLLNWDVKTPPAFFRMTAQEYRVFAAAGLGISDLKSFRLSQISGAGLQEFIQVREACGMELNNVLRRCVDLNPGLSKAVRYLKSQGDAAQMARFWRDYLEAAKKLDYDLSRPDVVMPKDLLTRHDEAVAAIKTLEDKQAEKAYISRFRRLTEQFTFQLDGLCVRVPQSIREIVSEGTTLRHCVAGYAERHMRGKVTILFLRKLKNPEAPYVTMELTTEENPRKLRIVQIHGFRNDREASEPPEVRHKDFLTTWLNWVHDGSPRREDGSPDIPETAEIQTEIA
ncbi:MAG: hypothetical protein HFF83_05015 [Oscillibacter sp.]|jgi:hypothetical protein|nr:hypothetical protein [Oscillibacter sp.]